MRPTSLVVHGSRVVVALNSERAFRDEVGDALDHPDGIRPVANEVAQEHVTLGAFMRGIVEVSRQRLTIGMDIGEECYQHGVRCCVVRWERIWRYHRGLVA